jgi:hypothetical protein
VKVKRFTANQRSLASSAYARFMQELAHYRADTAHLRLEKCAQRCAKLSALLTAAVLDSETLRALSSPV